MNAPFKHIEIEINTVCDLKCHACDRFSDVASKGVPNMSVSQVRRFVDESFELRWEWERIRALGGEPSLHPQFREIIEELIRYRSRFPKVFLQVLTNGLGRCDRHRAWLAERRVDLHAESKTKGETPEWFWNTRIVPLDRDTDVGELGPCGIFGERGCGVALTNHGYFLDGAGASVARVAGHDIGKMSLREVTWDAMLGQAKILCRECGHWNHPVRGVSKKVTETGEITGPFWQKKLAEYHAKRPELRVYGEGD